MANIAEETEYYQVLIAAQDDSASNEYASPEFSTESEVRRFLGTSIQPSTARVRRCAFLKTQYIKSNM